MKTAEQWEQEQEWTLDKASDIIAFTRAVQLDAIRHGMTLAMDVLQGIRGGDMATLTFCEQQILTARDRLTAEQLKPKV